MSGLPKEVPLKFGRLTLRGPILIYCLWLLIAVCSITLAFDLNLLPEEQEEEIPVLAPKSGQPKLLGAVEDHQIDDHEDIEQNKPKKMKVTGHRSWWNNVRQFTGNTVSSTISQLPQYFDFDKFTHQFKRHYTTAEALFRKSMFLKRCIEVFKARVAYRLGRKSYIQSVNKFADMSPNEIKRMFMSGPPIELRAAGQSEEDYYRELARVQRERDQWDAELTSKSSLGGDGSEEDDTTDMTILHESQAKRQIDLLTRSQSFNVEEQLAILEELRGASMDTFSQAAVESVGLPKRDLPWPGTRRPPADPVVGSSGRARAPYVAPEIEPADQIDWSEHQCFHKIYDQGTQCGKCYVMAATTLAEFYKCSEQLNVVDRRQFSKDYVLNCGQKFAPTILGCTGGSLLDTLNFISEAGMHNIRGWRALRWNKVQQLNSDARDSMDLKCPFNKMETPVRQWGEIRVGIKPVQVDANQWLEALEDGPLAASVQMPSEGLDGYAGGVHDGAGCATSGHWHSMVLVGYGLNERGIAYWRFRNSWGADWGDNGHFNMAMSVPGECLAGGVRVYRDLTSS